MKIQNINNITYSGKQQKPPNKQNQKRKQNQKTFKKILTEKQTCDIIQITKEKEETKMTKVLYKSGNMVTTSYATAVNRKETLGIPYEVIYGEYDKELGKTELRYESGKVEKHG